MAARGRRKPVRVLLADDHTMFRDGLAQFLSSHHGEVEVVGSVPNGEEALALAEREKPDLVIMQIETPIEKAKETLCRMLAISPRPQVLIVTMFENPDYVRELLGAGASAYLLKSARVEELVEVIRKSATDPDAVNDVVVGMPREGLEAAPGGYRDVLSEREMEVLLLAARGLSNRQIAGSLHLSESTVSRHLANIYDKMDVSSRVEAAKAAFARGWISLPDLTGDGAKT